MATIRVTVDDHVADILRRGGSRAESMMMDGLDELGAAFVAQARQIAGSGAYARSFSSGRSGTRSVIAGSTSPLAAIIEKGRKPGRRPPTSRNMSTSAADRIAQSGTRGRFVVKRAAASVRSDGTVHEVARRVVARITEE